MNEQLTVGSLFGGIGGFDLGLERAGMRTVWFCEQDPFCQRVLARHWPGVPCHPDVRELREPERVDVLCGGFPCPVISQAARGRNNAEWLWPEYARLVRELRPRYVIVENVARLLARGLDEILGDLAECGFDATWRVLDAADMGAPHHRARVWVVGYPHCDGQPDLTLDAETPRLPQLHGAERGWPDPPRAVGMDDGIPDRLHRGGDAHPGCIAEARAEGASDDDLLRAMRQHMALAAASRGPATCGVCGDPVSDLPRRGGLRGGDAEAAGAEDLRRLRERLHGVQPLAGEDLLAGVPVGARAQEREEAMGWWDREPDIPRVATGVPQRVDRLRALGNALVPQIAEWIGRQIIEWEARRPCSEPAGASRGQ